jgi:hypothetical protein
MKRGIWSFVFVLVGCVLLSAGALAQEGSFTIDASPADAVIAGGRISPAGSVTVAEGGSRTFLLFPASGYKIASLQVDGNDVVECDEEIDFCWIPSSYTFSNVTAPHTIAATFASALSPATTYQIMASPGSKDGAGGYISPAGEVSVKAGQNRTFAVIPAVGNKIASLTVDGSPVEDCDLELDICWVPNSYTFSNVTAPHTIAASFAPAVTDKMTYTISATPAKGGTAGGYISPAGEVSVVYGQNQAFAVVPDSGNKIASLTVDGSPVEDCDLELDICWVPSSYTFSNVTAPHDIAATFAPAATDKVTYTITAGPAKESSAPGYISPAGSVSVVEGQSQTFVVIPASGNKIASLMVDGSPVEDCDLDLDICWIPNSYTFSNVTAPHAIAATFVPAVTEKVTHTITAGPANGPDAAGYISPAGSVSVVDGQSQTFAVIPASGNKIVSLTVDGSPVEDCDLELDICWVPNSYTFSNVTASHDIAATFAPAVTEKATHTITASPAKESGAGGYISPAGGVSVVDGQSQTFVLLPGVGYKIASLTVDSSPVEECDEELNVCWVPSSYTFSNVTAPHTIAATFAALPVNNKTPYIITATAVGPGRISPSGNVKVKPGANQTFVFIPDRRRTMESLLVDGNPVTECDEELDFCWIPSSYTFTNVQGPHNITVTFK